MKITIDTKHDSVEEIEKVVRLLQELNGSVPPSSLQIMDLPLASVEAVPILTLPPEVKKEHYSAPLMGFNEILSNMSKKPKKENVEVVPY